MPREEPDNKHKSRMRARSSVEALTSLMFLWSTLDPLCRLILEELEIKTKCLMRASTSLEALTLPIVTKRSVLWRRTLSIAA